MTTGTREWHETKVAEGTVPAFHCDWDDDEDEDEDPDDDEDDSDEDDKEDEEPGWYVTRRPYPGLTCL